MKGCLHFLLFILVLFLLVAASIFLYLNGPDSASNIGDIVMSPHDVKALHVPTYVDALRLECLEAERQEDWFEALRLENLVVIEYLTYLQIDIARFKQK